MRKNIEKESEGMKEKIVLIDGNSIMNRAFYGLPPLTNSKGVHTNGVLGFMNIMFRILDEENPGYLAVAFDMHAPTFRHKMYKDYKGTRKGMPEELKEQMPLVRELLSAMNIPCVMKEGWEADDILGTLAVRAEKSGMTAVIVSGDRDLLQLADTDIKIRIPKTTRAGTVIEDYLPEDVVKKYGITPAQVVDMKALMGDSSDNIPGVLGIGEKTALSLLQQFPDLDSIYENLDKVKRERVRKLLTENKELAYMSGTLAKINTEADVKLEKKDAEVKDMFNKNTYVILNRLELRSLINRFDFSEDVVNSAVISEEPLTPLIEKKVLGSLADANEMLKKASGADITARAFMLIGEHWSNEYAKVKKRKGHGAAQLKFDFESGEIKTDDHEADADNYPFEGALFSFEEDKDGKKKIYSYCLMKGGRVKSEDILDVTEKFFGENREIWVFDVKNMLHLLENTSDGEIPGFFLKSYGYLSDASIAAYILDPVAGHYDIKTVASAYAGMNVQDCETLYPKMSFMNIMDEVRKSSEEFDRFTDMYMNQAEALVHMSGELVKNLKDKGEYDLMEKIEMPTAYYLYTMESAGIRADRESLSEMSDMFGKRIEVLEDEIYQLAGEKFNINSTKQLGTILFEKMHLPYAKKTKTGYSTAADVLEKLRDADPIIGRILEYRQLSKLKSTYADGLPPFIGPDGRIHGTFNQTVTATGRLSSADPNLQNIPVRDEMGRKLRSVFKPEEGCVFVDADYSQIELRLLAHMSGDQELIESYKLGKDIHAITASKVFNVPFDEVTKEQRRNAKAVNFGIIYGISSFGLGQDLGIPMARAKEYIKQYFRTYPSIKAFLDGLVKSAQERGYTETIYGRRRPVPELTASNHARKAFGERVAMNSPIQGSAADIIKIAMINVCRALKKEGLESRVVLQVHDELLVETKKSEVQKVKEILYREMTGAADLKVPLEVEICEGNDWYSAH